MIETIQYDKRDRMAFVILNRPDAKNAIDPAMHDELCRIWTDFRDDDAGALEDPFLCRTTSRCASVR